MTETSEPERARRWLVNVPGGVLEAFVGESRDPRAPVVCTAHPALAYGHGTIGLIEDLSRGRAVAVNPRGVGGSSPPPSLPFGEALTGMVDDLESVRRHLAIDRWTFWGMSGGAWLAMVYACRYPRSLAGVILESGCDCFRTLLADATSLLSPFHPAWRPALDAAGLIAVDSHRETGDPAATEWVDVDRVPPVFRRRGGPALFVSAVPATREVRAGLPLLWSIDLRSWLPRIRVPTLVIAGGADRITPVPRVRALHDAVAGSRWLVVEGGGHVPMIMRPTLVADAVLALVSAQAPGSAHAHPQSHSAAVAACRRSPARRDWDGSRADDDRPPGRRGSAPLSGRDR